MIKANTQRNMYGILLVMQPRKAAINNKKNCNLAANPFFFQNTVVGSAKRNLLFICLTAVSWNDVNQHWELIGQLAQLFTSQLGQL